MRIKLLIKITSVVLVLLGLSLRSAVSAGGSDEEVFPPKTLEKLKKIIQLSKRKTKALVQIMETERLKSRRTKYPKVHRPQKIIMKMQVGTKIVPIQEMVSAMC